MSSPRVLGEGWLRSVRMNQSCLAIRFQAKSSITLSSGFATIVTAVAGSSTSVLKTNVSSTIVVDLQHEQEQTDARTSLGESEGGPR